MKYINQRDYPHWLYVTRTDLDGEQKEIGKTTTVFTSACGPCAAVMVADRLLPNCGFTLSDALDLSYAVKANHKIGTDYARFAPAFAEKLGLKMQPTRDLEELRRCLRTGGAAVALVLGDRDGQVGIFAHSGHYVMVLNEEPDGRLALLDPYFYDGKYEEEARKDKVELKNDYIVLTEGETLDSEVTVKSMPYYLFWRG